MLAIEYRQYFLQKRYSDVWSSSKKVDRMTISALRCPSSDADKLDGILALLLEPTDIAHVAPTIDTIELLQQEGSENLHGAFKLDELLDSTAFFTLCT
jgi:hypothetical protein